VRAHRFLWVGALTLVATLAAFQRPFREYPGVEYSSFQVPADALRPSEFVFARLMYPPAPTARFDYSGPRWAQGRSSWTQDYPRADRHFLLALNRLSRIDARPVEQPVNLDDDDDVFNWPFLYAVRTGEWNLTQAQADKMRDFLNRGGFFMTDDFWGSFEWQVFEQSMRRVYPDREIADIPNPDAIFHGIFDLSDRYQIPGAWGLRGRPYQNDGDTPYWRAIRDDKGRIVVGMIPNSDLGDSWEYADDPYYPERYSALGIRTTINYIAYAMSH